VIDGDGWAEAYNTYKDLEYFWEATAQSRDAEGSGDGAGYPWLLHYLSEGTVPDLPWDDYDYDADEDATPEDVYDAIYARLERTR